MNNMKLPYFPLYAGDFSLGTEELTNAETGAYIRLLIHQWKNKSLPKVLTGKLVCYLDEWPALEQYFPLCSDGRRRNPRLEEERQKITDRREKQRLGGIKSAESRKQPTKLLTKQLPKSPPNIAESYSESQSEEDSKKKKDYSEEFELFWKVYPKKIGKRKAEEAWKKLKPPLQICIQQLEAMKKSEDWLKDSGQFIPHPTTWLNGGRWDDEKPKEDTRQVGKLPTYKTDDKPLTAKEQAETDIARKQALKDVKEWGKKHTAKPRKNLTD